VGAAGHGSLVNSRWVGSGYGQWHGRWIGGTVELSAYMQNRVTNSLRYLVNAKPGTNHSTNPTNPNGNSKQ